MARLPANTRKRKDGLFEKRFTVNGQRYSIYARTTKELQEKEQELREQIKSNSYIRNKQITLDKYFEYWISEKEKSIKQNTSRLYRHMYEYNIKSKLGNHRLHSFERREIVAFQNDLIANGINTYSTNYTIMVLGMIFADAIRDGILQTNPASKIKKISDDRKSATETIHKALTETEQALFMNAIRDNYYYPLFAFLLSTGMRFGEAGALQWSDIDYRANVIHITKSLSRDKNDKYIIGTPKSKASIRDIPLTDTTKNILKLVKKQTAMISNVVTIDGLIFHNPEGGFVHNQTVNQLIKKTITGIQNNGGSIHEFSLHCFRDTFATRFVEQGGNPQTLKALLGHSSLAMTMDLYSQVMPNTKQTEMDKIHIAI